ncbi:MAG TPA: RNA polymerase sigma factor [Steroidobacteraceae bacterium]|jgi:DNA-directed RNA polymerase specialized sigma24 family protein|nr:RNA polymerase sigma factor [Steroidobacteraceae bacterium]
MADARHDWFTTEVCRHRTALQRYLSRFASGAADIEELVQDTFVRVYALDDYRSVESPKALLFRIGHKLAVERARRQPHPATDRGMDGLAPLCRRVLQLRKVFKLSLEEISQVLDLSPSAIEKHVVRGLVGYRDYLRESGLLETMDPKLKPGTVCRLRDGGDAE